MLHDASTFSAIDRFTRPQEMRFTRRNLCRASNLAKALVEVVGGKLLQMRGRKGGVSTSLIESESPSRTLNSYCIIILSLG